MTWTGIHDPTLRARLAGGSPPPLLPLDQEQALARALELRLDYDLNCHSISMVMGLYHGQWATEDAWRRRLLVAGAAPRQGGARGRSRRRLRLKPT